MLKKRIIPCLDIQNGRTVKGVNFVDLVDMGNPVELAQRYSEQGADELVFLDITASHEKRNPFPDLVTTLAKEISIPFTVGGGIRSVDHAKMLFSAGADKVAVNSAAVERPELISEIAAAFGNQSLVLAVDVKKVGANWLVFTQGGRHNTKIDATDWIQRGIEMGVGEILLTSMDRDGVKGGFDLDITKRIVDQISVPLIASGGAGESVHFRDLFTVTGASAGLAASIFHSNKIPVPQLKSYLTTQNISIRCN